MIEHHARHFTPDNAFLVAVGDFDTRRFRALVKTTSAAGSARGERCRICPESRLHDRKCDVSRIRASRCIWCSAISASRATHPDFDALAVLDHIFGSGPGFTDRLSRIVRDELGLAYSVGGGITDSADVAPGLFRVYAGTQPDEANRVVAAVLESDPGDPRWRFQ